MRSPCFERSTGGQIPSSGSSKEEPQILRGSLLFGAPHTLPKGQHSCGSLLGRRGALESRTASAESVLSLHKAQLQLRGSGG